MLNSEGVYKSSQIQKRTTQDLLCDDLITVQLGKQNKNTDTDTGIEQKYDQLKGKCMKLWGFLIPSCKEMFHAFAILLPDSERKTVFGSFLEMA